MLRLIFKNIIANRKRNKWIFAELIIVTSILWYLLDPVIVNLYNCTLPDGFNMDRLYVVNFYSYPEESAKYNEEYDNGETTAKSMERFLRMIRADKDVKYATYMIGSTGPYGFSKYIMQIEDQKDSTQYTLYRILFQPKTDFFKTFEFDGSDDCTNSQIDDMDFGYKDRVISDKFLPGQKSLGYREEHNDTLEWTVKATTSRVKMATEEHPYNIIMEPASIYDYYMTGISIALRLKEDVNEQEFLMRFNKEVRGTLQAGNLYAQNIQSYREIEDSVSNGIFDTANLVMAIFFILSIFLGISGAFFMQTRNRREDIGIMKSFGCRANDIIMMMIGEGVVIATAATVAGCLIILIISRGEYPQYYFNLDPDSQYWMNVFWKRFLIISGIIWLIEFIIVIIGVAIPATMTSRISPVDALRDE